MRWREQGRSGQQFRRNGSLVSREGSLGFGDDGGGENSCLSFASQKRS